MDVASIPPAQSSPSTNPRKRRSSPRKLLSRANSLLLDNINTNGTDDGGGGGVTSRTLLLSPPSFKRRSGRGSSSLWQLARFIKEGKRVVFVTGAGLSVASGVRAFRTTNNSSRLYMGTTDSPKKKKQKKRATNPPKRKKQKKTSAATEKGIAEEQPLGIWNSVLWTQAKRETFRKDALVWWNDFWLRYFPVDDYENKYKPNAGHVALAALQQAFPEIRLITQNVDGLQQAAIDQLERHPDTAAQLKENIVEAHGRLGLYKCLPAEDSDTDSSSDEDDERPVHLGHRRKYRAWKRRYHADSIARRRQQKKPDPPAKGEPEPAVVSTDVSSGSCTSESISGSSPTCQFQMTHSLRVDQLSPPEVRAVLRPPRANPPAAANDDCTRDDDEHDERPPRCLREPPCCPNCGNRVLPQALLFDEGYHSHEHYNFTQMEDWLAAAEVLVFVGTSFAVTLPLVALDHAKETGLPVFNFNVSDTLEPNARLNAENITGPSQETLPKLWQAVQYLEEKEPLMLG